jgi:hypothetical protein
MLGDIADHPRSGRSAPQRISADPDAKRAGMVRDIRKRGRQIFRGQQFAPHPVSEDKGVVSSGAQFHGEGKTLMQGADIRKSAARTDHGKRRTLLAPQEKQTGQPFARVLLLLLLVIKVMKYGQTCGDIINHTIQSTNNHIRSHMPMVRHEQTDVSQRRIQVCRIVVPRQQQRAKSAKGRMSRNVADTVP